MFGEFRPMPTQQHDERFQLLIDSIKDYAIYMLDCSGHVITWNRGAEINKGYSSAEILGRHFHMFFVPEDVASGAPGRELREAATLGRCAGEGWRLRKNGERFWASFVLSAMIGTAGELVGFAKVTRDLSDRKRQEDAMFAMDAALREERDRMRAAAESSMDALFICEAVRGLDGEIDDFIFTYLNSNVEKLVSLPRNALLGRRMGALPLIDQARALLEAYKDVAVSGRPLVREFPVQPEEPRGAWLRVQVVKLRDGLAITAADITQRKRDESRILHLAQHDPLTELPNRSVLADRIAHALERAIRYRNKVGIFLLDLDDFKQVNDTLGHAVGDQLLVTIARRLLSSVRAIDSIIRIGGDEFIAIIPDIQKNADLDVVAGKLIKGIQSPLVIGSHSLQVSCSIGIAVFPDTATSSQELLHQADMAMYEAKRSGKNHAKRFEVNAVRSADIEAQYKSRRSG